MIKKALSIVASNYYKYIGGQFWVGYWYYGGARASFFRDVCGLELAGDLWDRARAYESTMESACWWWPHRDFVMVSDRPAEIHREQVGPTGWGSHRLHREDGPAIVWRDGWGLHFWHGTRVPAWLTGSDGGVTPEKIAAEENVEVRRCAIEAYGWDRYITDAGLTLVATDGYGDLFDVPTQLWGDRVRVVLVTNGTPERDGTVRRYGLTVPEGCRTPLEAVAWTYGLAPDAYATLERRT